MPPVEGRRVQSRRPLYRADPRLPQSRGPRACQDGHSRLAENKKTKASTKIQDKQVMPSKFAKVQKQVSKKKGGALALHENSRDALRLRAAVARDDRVARLGAVREKLNDAYRMFCLDSRSLLD
jgi:hypothetical protein